MAADELEDILDELDSDETEVKNEDEGAKKKSKSRERIEELGKKYILTAKERDALKKENEDLKFKDEFNSQFSKYPFAKDHQAEIKEQVSKGLSVEDATLLILTKNKKLLSPEEIKKSEMQKSSLGGSADTTHISGETKQPKDMSQSERLEALREAESKGEISLS